MTDALVSGLLAGYGVAVPVGAIAVLLGELAAAAGGGWLGGRPVPRRAARAARHGGGVQHPDRRPRGGYDLVMRGLLLDFGGVLVDETIQPVRIAEALRDAFSAAGVPPP